MLRLSTCLKKACSTQFTSYGMMVTDIVKAMVIYDGDWLGDEYPDLTEALADYNEKKSRVLFYPWGVFVTAYARRNLYTGILEFGKDYIYSDTDSIKCINMDKHKAYVDNYNRWITHQIDTVLKAYGIDPEESRPKNIKGVSKQIGVWDWETEKEPYTAFKTLGAKRYIYEQSGELHITIAGVSKKLGKDFLKSKSDPFEFFSDEMEIDAGHSGKLTHTYLDDEQEGTLYDYTGKAMHYYEKSSVHLERSAYRMSMLQDFKDFCEEKKRSIRL